MVNIEREGTHWRLMLSATQVLLDNKPQQLVTIENIGRELIDAEYQAWKNLISVLTHEVMNSVTPVVSLAHTCSDILSQQGLHELPQAQLCAELDDARIALHTIVERSQGIMRFVQSYRQLGSLPKPQPQPVLLAQLFDEQLRLHQTLCQQQGIHLSVELKMLGLSIYVDRQQLEQVLLNVFKNACDALHEAQSKTIHLLAYLKLGAVVIRIEDSGCGMAGDVLTHIFIPFYTTKHEGTGIGLPLSRQLMHANGGQIHIDSTLGQGTRVELIFNG